MNQITKLTEQISQWAQQLGFQAVGIADVDLRDAEQQLLKWLDDKCHGDMDWMERHGSKRSHPEQLVPGTVRCISVRMNYWPANTEAPFAVLRQGQLAYISRYALGRDYHKIMRKRLQKLSEKINTIIKEDKDYAEHFDYRVFVDSAPVLEKPLAEKAGLGWIGKHSNLIDKETGSYFFIGEIYTNLPLEVSRTKPVTSHCGSCTSCISECPTQAIIAPYVVDARRCISYLTIELKGSIPESLRTPMGNRIYGCDDCQLVCPWNKFTSDTQETDFQVRHNFDRIELLTLFNWTEEAFLKNTEGSAIRRIGYERWQRNIAVALGNADYSKSIIQALTKRLESCSEMVAEHVQWALQQHAQKANTQL